MRCWAQMSARLVIKHYSSAKRLSANFTPKSHNNCSPLLSPLPPPLIKPPSPPLLQLVFFKVSKLQSRYKPRNFRCNWIFPHSGIPFLTKVASTPYFLMKNWQKQHKHKKGKKSLAFQVWTMKQKGIQGLKSISNKEELHWKKEYRDIRPISFPRPYEWIWLIVQELQE